MATTREAFGIMGTGRTWVSGWSLEKRPNGWVVTGPSGIGRFFRKKKDAVKYKRLVSEAIDEKGD